MQTVKLKQTKRNKIDPKIFALLLACASMTMVFLAYTSAYIIRQAAGNWLEFRLPNEFFISTGILFLSSICIHFSYRFFKKKNTSLYRGLLLLTLVLGIIFIYIQYLGWQQMLTMGIELNTNPSGSFVYVISGMHIAHVFGGLGVLITALLHAFLLEHRVTEKRILRFRLTLIYWHFVDFLWIYLLIFFTLQKV